MAAPVRCGRISYTNDLPVYAGFDEDAIPFPGSMQSDCPAALNRALLEGSLDCSPISSAFYAEHAEAFVLLPDICIGSKAEVRSICCIANRPLQELGAQTVWVTDESSTGRALLATICRHWYGFMPKLQASDDPFAAYIKDESPCLLIGDAAIEASFVVPPDHVNDLGRLWHDLSSDEMVYAVWAARTEFASANPSELDAVTAALQDSLRWGLQHRHTLVSRAQSIHRRPSGFYESYYEGLNYYLDSAAQAGLKHFFDIACAAGVLTQSPSLRFYNEAAAGV